MNFMTNSQDLLNANIISALGLEALPMEEKQAMIEKMTDLLMKRVMLRVMDELSDEVLATMPKEGSNPEELVTFIADNVPTYDAIMQEELVKLKAEVLKAAEQVG